MDRTYKILLILSLILGVMQPVQAQHILKGVVYDEAGTGVFSTTLRILTEDSVFVSGGITDDNGNFEIKNIKAGRYILAVSNIGYAGQCIAFEMPGSDYTLPTVVLKTDVVALGEVTVKGSTFIRKKDHLLVLPDKQQIKHAFSGYDLLYNLMIPGLDVNRKDKKVTATAGEATLYINGVKADFRDVQNLRPRDIEKVEYYSMPTGKYTGDAASINYITKTYTTGGYVNMEAEQKIGYLGGNYDAAAKLSHKQTNYTFFGGYNIKDYDGIKREKRDELFFKNHTIDRFRTKDHADDRNNQQYAQLRVSNHSEKRNLSGTFSFVQNRTPRNDMNEILKYNGQNEQTISSSEKTENTGLKPALDLTGQFNLSEKHIMRFTLQSSYAQNEYSRTYTEDQRRSYTHVNEDLYYFAINGFYLYMPNKQNTCFISAWHRHNIASSTYSGDYDSKQHLWNGETTAILDYDHHFGENTTLSLNPGFALLNYKLRDGNHQRFFRLYIHTWIRHRFNSQHWGGLGFFSTNSSPDINLLNTVDQTIDFHQLKRGNPDLGYTKTYRFYTLYEGRIKKFNAKFLLWYEMLKNNIYLKYYLEGDKLISSYRSDDSFNSLNSDCSLSYAISDNLRAKCTLKYEYMYIPEKTYLNQHNFVVAFDINYFIKSFAINVYAKTQEKRLENRTLVFTQTPASYGLSVRYSNRNLMAEAGTENPFTQQAQYREYADYNIYRYDQTQTSRIYQQTAYLKLAYTFDFGRKTSREQSEVDKTIKSAILKAE